MTTQKKIRQTNAGKREVASLSSVLETDILTIKLLAHKDKSGKIGFAPIRLVLKTNALLLRHLPPH